jgi:hypothetical protein
MAELWTIVGIIAFSALKFFLAPPAAIIAGLSFFESILYTSIGGIGGFLIFFHFGKLIRRFFIRSFKTKPKPKFSKRNRKIIRIKNSYGFWGLAFLTPCLLGIPLGAILAAGFYGKQKWTSLVFCLLIVFWSVILSLLSYYIKS